MHAKSSPFPNTCSARPTFVLGFSKTPITEIGWRKLNLLYPPSRKFETACPQIRYRTLHIPEHSHETFEFNETFSCSTNQYSNMLLLHASNAYSDMSIRVQITNLQIQMRAGGQQDSARIRNCCEQSDRRKRSLYCRPLIVRNKADFRHLRAILG